MAAKRKNPPPDGVGRASDWLFSLPANTFQIVQNAAIEQAKNLAALVASIDPATVAGLAFVLIGGPRQ